MSDVAPYTPHVAPYSTHPEPALTVEGLVHIGPVNGPPCLEEEKLLGRNGIGPRGCRHQDKADGEGGGSEAGPQVSCEL